MPTTIDDVYETRRENLSKLLKEPGAKTQLATRLGASQSHITHLLKPPTAPSSRAIREETARQIEQIMGLDPGRLDQPDIVMLPADGQPPVFVEVKRSPARSEHPALARERAERAELTQVRNHLVHARQPDPAIVEQAFALVFATLAEQQIQLPPEKAAKMARLVFEQALVSGKVDRALVVTLIDLMS